MIDDNTAAADAGDVEFDLDAIREDAREGAKALAYLFDNVVKDWDRWVLSIRGLRGLRDLARHNSGAHNLTDFGYRQEIGRLLSQRQYAVYDRLSKTQRSACYKLMDNLDDVDDWYHGRANFQGYPISDDNRMNWKSPETIIKHCPPQLIGREDKVVRTPKRPQLPKPVKPEAQAEIDRLRKLLLMVIKRLAKHEPDVLELLEQVQPPGLPDDSTEDI